MRKTIEELETNLAYRCILVDQIILGSIVTTGNVHDSTMFEPLLEKVIKNHRKPVSGAADAGYKTPAIAQY